MIFNGRKLKIYLTETTLTVEIYKVLIEDLNSFIETNPLTRRRKNAIKFIINL